MSHKQSVPHELLSCGNNPIHLCFPVKLKHESTFMYKHRQAGGRIVIWRSEWQSAVLLAAEVH